MTLCRPSYKGTDHSGKLVFRYQLRNVHHKMDILEFVLIKNWVSNNFKIHLKAGVEYVIMK